MAFTTTLKKRTRLFPVSVFLRLFMVWIIPVTIAVLLMMAFVPIKWTPFACFMPEVHYSGWRQVSTLKVIQIVRRPLPTGVRPLPSCPHNLSPKLTEKDVAMSKIKVFSLTNTSQAVRQLMHARMGLDLTDFLPILDRDTKVTLLYTYTVMDRALRDAGVSHVLLDGGLLGVYRFQSMTPWDDDLDVGVEEDAWMAVRDALSCIQGFHLLVSESMRWSFYPSDGSRSNTPAKKYPFIDIFFIAQDSTHVWGVDRTYRRKSLIGKELFYPTRWGLMDGIHVPVPNNVKKVLESQYGDLDVCVSQDLKHRPTQRKVSRKKIPCSWLYPVYGRFPIG